MINRSAVNNFSTMPNLMALRATFLNPPVEYGPIPFYWWVGEKLDKERICWQLDQLKSAGIMSAVISYSHHPDGSGDWGDPAVFSTEWWDLLRWVLDACRERDMTLGFQDYSIAPKIFRELGEDTPDMQGGSMIETSVNVTGPRTVQLENPLIEDEICFIAAFACPVVNGELDLDHSIDLSETVTTGRLNWLAAEGEWRVTRIDVHLNPFDAMHPQSGALVLDQMYEVFVRECPDHVGSTLNLFFQDELDFGGRMPLWSNRLLDEFRSRKGYDLLPCLPALWHDCGPRTPKIRLDFGDVITQLQEERFFIPVYEWSEAHGVLLGHDNYGRGDITEGSTVYGDYFRTMRWYSAPGADDPRLASPRAFKGPKLNSSIAHLYNRPRVWCEAFHSSGWGATPAQIIAGLNQEYVYGASLFNPHGLYYSTFGSWWEWAPPDTHFRQPYWIHSAAFTDYVRRLSYLLSAGHHRCDVALVYPLPTLETEQTDANQTEEQVWELAKSLFDAGIDFDFVDFESFERAQVEDGRLLISEQSYAVMLFPYMTTARLSTLQKAHEFYEEGGLVIVVGALPTATENAGRNDPLALSLWNSMLGTETFTATQTSRSAIGGQCVYLADDFTEIERLIVAHAGRDFETLGVQELHALHRQIGELHTYFVFNPHSEFVQADVAFRCSGQVEIWDAWSGTGSLIESRRHDDRTMLNLSLQPGQGILLVISPQLSEAKHIIEQGTTQVIDLDGNWEFELEPTMDNRYGDFRLPATPILVGTEVRRFRYWESSNVNEDYSAVELDDSQWPEVTASYGQRFWKIGPFPASSDLSEVEAKLRKVQQLDATKGIFVNGHDYNWEPYDFSTQWGIDQDPFHLDKISGPHGLKKRVPDDFLDLNCDQPGATWYLWSSVESKEEQLAPVIMGSRSSFLAWLNSEEIFRQDESLPPGVHTVWGLPHYDSEPLQNHVELYAGSNPLLLRFTQPEGQRVRSYIAFNPPTYESTVPALRWFSEPANWQFNALFDVCDQVSHRIGWYRFDSPPGLKAFEIAVRGTLQTYVGGAEVVPIPLASQNDEVSRFRIELPTPSAHPVQVTIHVQLQSGSSGGDAILEPVLLECGVGTVKLGDWADLNLTVYSGAAWYRRTVEIPELKYGTRVRLELGDVAATASVRLNGSEMGELLTPPWSLDITEGVRVGENLLEIQVANTLANHYSVGIPTPYVLPGQTRSGLLGPVSILLH